MKLITKKLVETKEYTIQQIDIDNYDGLCDGICVMDATEFVNGTIDNALTLLGFDEVGMFDHEFNNPIYVKITFKK